MKKPYIYLFILFIFSLGSVFFSITKGTIAIPTLKIISSFFYHSDPVIHSIVFNIRIPRTLNAFITGGLLGLSGVLMQALLRNPLADPYILGTSAGASFAIVFSLFIGFSSIVVWPAWAGSFLAMLVLFFLIRNQDWHKEHLILIGVALSGAFSALTSLIIFLSPAHHLHAMFSWLMGDLETTVIPWMGIIILLCCFLVSLFFTSEFNILLRGEREAFALGLETKKIKNLLFILSSILTATAVSLAGCIGFIGLIIPHCIRLTLGSRHEFLIPGSILLGGSLLTITDMLARTLFEPNVLPVGFFTALLGIPVFLFLLYKNRTCLS